MENLRPCALKAIMRKQLYDSAEMQEAEKRFPKEFVWAETDASKNGVVPPVMDQADCGSCYMVSSMRMLTARKNVKILRTKKESAAKLNDAEKDNFSISFPLHCGEYNQGCKGGYGFLAAKWSSDIGMIPSKCFPYDTKSKCPKTNLEK